ncbi:unnamed protein product [Ectocarpus sp. 12 AP-2014]
MQRPFLVSVSSIVFGFLTLSSCPYGLYYDWSLSYSCLVVVFMVFCLLSHSSFAHSLDHGACFNRVLRVVFIVFSVSSRRQGMTALDGKQLMPRRSSTVSG